MSCLCRSPVALEDIPEVVDALRRVERKALAVETELAKLEARAWAREVRLMCHYLRSRRHQS